VSGEIDTISSITAADLRNFARSHWTKYGLKVAVAGDITKPALAKLLGQTFLPVSGAQPPALPNVGRLGAPGVRVIALPVPQPTAVFGLPGIMRADPDFIPGYVANYILGGGGFSSRLMEEVRVKRGLTYGVSTALTSYNKASVMQGSVATRADAIRQTVQVVKDTMANFAANGPTQAELDDAKTYLTGSFPLAFASNSGTASQLGTFLRQNLDIGYVARRNSLIQAVTLDDVKRVAKRLCIDPRIGNAQHEQPIGMFGPWRSPRSLHTFNALDRLDQLRGPFAPPVHHILDLRQLRQRHRPGQLAHAVVLREKKKPARTQRAGIARPRFIGKQQRTLRKRRIRRYHQPALAARDVLALLQTEASHVTHGADQAAGVLSPVGLRTVFDESQLACAANAQ